MKNKMPSFEQVKILVVGDIMLDRYWHGDVSRISPEAPVPVMRVKNIEERIGGAGNVALNISSLGACATILSLVGEDDIAKKLEQLLKEKNVTSKLLRIPGVPTISKLRAVARSQQLLRLDLEDRFDQWDEESFLDNYKKVLPNIDAVIFSDYNKGALRRCSEMIELAKGQNKLVLVDPKSKDFSIYRGATVITPNLAEFEAVVGPCKNDADIEAKALELIAQYDFEAVLITRGAQGMSLVRGDQPLFNLPTKAQEVYDVTGAGDTVIATLGVALASGEAMPQAVSLANAAAGIAVQKLGATAVSVFELRRAMRHKPGLNSCIVDEEHLLSDLIDARTNGEKIVMTNGCFDIIHPGHVIYLEQAKLLGQKLIVAVNDDDSVRRLKGEERPINSLQARMAVLAALDSVDFVVPFSEDTPERLIKRVSPDVLVKGGDYQVHEIAGSDHVIGNNGEVVIIPFEDGFSTTSMLNKIKETSD